MIPRYFKTEVRYKTGKLRYVVSHMSYDGKLSLCGINIPASVEEVSKDEYRVCGQCMLHTQERSGAEYESELDNKFNRIYDEIINFIHWMAHRNCNEEHVMLSFEDVEQELFEEFIKGFKHYCEKPDSQLKAILRQMVANRCSELKYRHFVTHRVKANINISIDMNITCERIHTEDGNPEALLLSKERVEQTRLALSPNAQKVFDSLIAGDEHLSWIAWMNCTRRNSTGKGMAKVHIEPWMVSEATNLDERVVKDAMKEIEAAYYMLGG